MKRFLNVLAIWGCIGVVALITEPPPVEAQTDLSYPSITSLDRLSDARSQVWDISNDGQVVGFRYIGNERFESYVYNGADWATIESVGGGAHKSYAINENGQVVGAALVDEQSSGFLWCPETGMTDLGTLGGNSTALALNENGDVVGYADLANLDVYRAFVWRGERLMDLGTLGGKLSTAYDINDQQQVVGQAHDTHQNRRAFIWSLNDGMTALPVPPATTASTALRINDMGQIVGFRVDDTGATHACLWQDGALANLGTLGGSLDIATDVNNGGQVVGYSETKDGTRCAFMWQNGQIKDLNDILPPNSGWVLTEARGINDAQQIVGLGTLNGEDAAFLLDLDVVTAEK